MMAALCLGVYLVMLDNHQASGGAVGFMIECAFAIVCMHIVVSTQKGRAEIERRSSGWPRSWHWPIGT